MNLSLNISENLMFKACFKKISLEKFSTCSSKIRQFIPCTDDNNCISRSSTATCTADATSGAVEWDFELGEGVDDASFKQCTGLLLNVFFK